MGVESLAKRVVVASGRLVGLNVFVFQNQTYNDLVVVNRSYLKRYYEHSPFLTLYRKAMAETNSQARDSFEKQCRYYGLYQMALRVLRANVAGDFAECGCWRGHSAYMLAELMRSSGGPSRQLHIFDSFEGGLSDKSDEDRRLLAKVESGAVHREKQAFYSTEAEVSQALAKFHLAKLHPGWIPHRFADVQNQTFALVNLDVDLYQPIKDSLEFFFPRLSRGGVIVVDDYGTTEWPGVQTAVDEFLERSPVTFAIETLGSMIILK